MPEQLTSFITETFSTELSLSASIDNINVLRVNEMLGKKPNLNDSEVFHEYNNPLIEAVEKRNLEIVKMLLAYDEPGKALIVDKNLERLAIETAITYKAKEVFDYLVAQGYELNADKEEAEVSPIHAAIQRDHYYFDILLSKGVKINGIYKKGELISGSLFFGYREASPAHLAAIYGDKYKVKKLIDLGADKIEKMLIVSPYDDEEIAERDNIEELYTNNNRNEKRIAEYNKIVEKTTTDSKKRSYEELSTDKVIDDKESKRFVNITPEITAR